MAPHASPRAYPSAHASNVRERPREEVIPAMAKLVPMAGASIIITPDATPDVHSTLSDVNAR